MSVLVGDIAPDFVLIDQHGDEFKLKNIIGEERIIVFFYPKDETPGCVAEACGFRDSFEEFANLNCKVVGISKDSVNSHAKFAKHYNLPYVLLSDPKKDC